MITQNGINYYSLEEIRNYLNSMDSMGDIHYFLNEKNIQKANTKTVEEEDELNGHPYPGHEMYE